MIFLKDLFNKYMDDEIKLEKWQSLCVFCLIVVFSGFFGWVYEFFFYYLNSGMKTFYYRGANFLPWINIYATGAIMIILLTKRFKKQPILVFLLSAISTGILEYVAGYLMYHFDNGIRCWNYNTEILNYGNIDGFVCLRSVTFFGLSAILLMYLIVPLFIYISKKASKKTLICISVTLFAIVIFDELYNLVFANLFGLPRARDIYSKIGYKYMNYYK